MFDEKLMDAFALRRTNYAINCESAVGAERVREIVGAAVRFAPSAFNSRSARCVLLFGESHAALWDIVMSALRAKLPADRFGPSEKKVSGFAAGFGTALFFDDSSVTERFARDYPSYSENFDAWAGQANGMLQFMVWTALCNEGLGASLQHYNPLIDGAVRARFGLPESWRLLAQMPFGRPSAPPAPRDCGGAGEHVRVFR